MDLPEKAHLARVLAVLGGIALGLGGMAFTGAFREDGRSILVIGSMVMLLVGALVLGTKP